MTSFLLQALNDFGIIKELLEKQKIDYDNNKTILIIYSLVTTLNIVAIVINYIVQLKIKNADKKIHAFKIREDKRIVIYEQIYQILDSIVDLNPQNEQQEILTKITEVEKIIATKNIYIDKQIKKVTTNFLDYAKEIITQPRKRSYERSAKFLETFKSEFNK
ncbi:MAG: hypothetical protein QM541_09585 [Flavobacterium sp.]|nr:hypothetical protein [Flavobacterium sp.]